MVLTYLHTESDLLRRGSIRQINWTLDAEAFFGTLTRPASGGGRPESPVVTMIFEHVRDGTSFRQVDNFAAYACVCVCMDG